jgi:methylated-DNA-[protein]-cysteine S-methyltransferase
MVDYVDKSCRAIKSPLGELYLVVARGALEGLYFTEEAGADLLKACARPVCSKEDEALLDEVCAQLAEYFAGERKAFEINLAMRGTPFQDEAWRALQQIPYGITISYRDQAESLGSAAKARAVGQANGRNPISIIVPCHRVIAADGSLGGYGGGLARKRWLLLLEGAHAE